MPKAFYGRFNHFHRKHFAKVKKTIKMVCMRRLQALSTFLASLLLISLLLAFLLPTLFSLCHHISSANNFSIFTIEENVLPITKLLLNDKPKWVEPCSKYVIKYFESLQRWPSNVCFWSIPKKQKSVQNEAINAKFLYKLQFIVTYWVLSICQHIP